MTFFTDPPSPTAVRTLTLVAKSVQNLANLVEFGAKVCFAIHMCIVSCLLTLELKGWLCGCPVYALGALHGRSESIHQE